MVYAKDSFKTHLNVHSHTIPPHQGNLKEAVVKIKTAEQTVLGIGHRHEGGQRVTLPNELHTTIVNHLLNGTPVTIELIGFSTTLEPSDFTRSYQEMGHSPIKVPVQFSFKI